jgi:hypothetical protein
MFRSSLPIVDNDPLSPGPYSLCLITSSCINSASILKSFSFIFFRKLFSYYSLDAFKVWMKWLEMWRNRAAGNSKILWLRSEGVVFLFYAECGL